MFAQISLHYQINQSSESTKQVYQSSKHQIEGSNKIENEITITLNKHRLKTLESIERNKAQTNHTKAGNGEKEKERY